MLKTLIKDTSVDQLVKMSSDLVLDLKSKGVDKKEILLQLALIGNKLSGPGTTCSILILDEDGLLRNGASPDLPDDYLAAIDRIKPDPNVGTCAAAAATGRIVITTDFYQDNKWAELRQLPLGLGYIAAWSMPIKDFDNKVLGTIGTYFRDRRHPTANEQTGIQILATAATLALQN